MVIELELFVALTIKALMWLPLCFDYKSIDVIAFVL